MDVKLHNLEQNSIPKNFTLNNRQNLHAYIIYRSKPHIFFKINQPPTTFRPLGSAKVQAAPAGAGVGAGSVPAGRDGALVFNAR